MAPRKSRLPATTPALTDQPFGLPGIRRCGHHRSCRHRLSLAHPAGDHDCPRMGVRPPHTATCSIPTQRRLPAAAACSALCIRPTSSCWKTVSGACGIYRSMNRTSVWWAAGKAAGPARPRPARLPWLHRRAHRRYPRDLRIISAPHWWPNLPGRSDHRPGRARGAFPRRHRRGVGVAADPADVVELQEPPSAVAPRRTSFPTAYRATTRRI